jgi:predicted phosphodiesterase
MNEKMDPLCLTPIRRRQFVKGGLVLMGAQMFNRGIGAEALSAPRSRVGLITDLHYADKPTAGTRHYRESLLKLREAGKQFHSAQISHVIELGDLIDAADSVEVEQSYLKVIHEEFLKIPGEKHYVLGNHCVDTLTKGEFLGGVGATRSYYSFDEAGFHFVILDACFRSDGKPYERRNFEWTDPNIPPSELEWFKQDLSSTSLPVVVFVHQRLDVGEPHGIKNAIEIRELIEKSGKVTAVFQGHSHKNDYRQIKGVHYVTLVAMVEGSGLNRSGYSILNLHDDGVVTLTGHREQASHSWGK